MAPDTPAPIPGLQGWAKLGVGGFGVVYRAEDVAHSRTVAVKVLSAADLDERTLRAFDRERTAMGRLSGHPNIVTVYQSGLDADGRPFIVMDHMAGGSLADRVAKDGPMPWADAAAIGVRIAAALQAAHGMGVLHRDVKPANILLTAWGEVKLADFGIAALASATGTATGGNSASIAHAAPEVVDGRRPTAASDVYSLGSTLHTLVSGAPPFHVPGEESIVPMLARIMQRDPPDLAANGVDEGFAAAVRQALAKDPADRFPTAEAFGRRLQQLLRDAGHDVPAMVTDLTPSTPRGPIATAAPTLPADDLPGAPPDGEGPPPRRWPRVVVVAAVLAVGAAAVVATRPGDPGPGTIVFREITADGPRLSLIDGSLIDGSLTGGEADGDPVTLDELGDVGRPAMSPDGTRIAVVADGALRLVDPASGDSTVVVEGESHDPDWSPDGTQLAYAADVGGQRDLFVVDAAGGEARRLTDTAQDEGSPAWTATGETVLFDSDVAGSFDIWAVEVASGEVRQVTAGPADEETPAAHPTDDVLVVVRRGPTGRTDLVLVRDDGSGEEVELVKDLADVGSPAFSPDGRRLVFSSDSRGDFDLWVLVPDTGSVDTLWTAPGHQTDPHWAG